MQAISITLAPPTEDKRWRIVQTAMRRQGFAPDALIETLHSAQAAFGYLDEPSLKYVAQSLHVPLSRVYGVATFYNLFTLKPQGAHTCVVCLGTACYIKGGQQILAALEQLTGVHRGETTPDKQVSLMVARCLGTCGLAPAVVLDEEVAGQVKPNEMVERVKEWLNHEPG
ncbi:MAG: bidirectional hydrogenase complex protein HoxE [Chloroflexota bacterium]